MYLPIAEHQQHQQQQHSPSKILSSIRLESERMIERFNAVKQQINEYESATDKIQLDILDAESKCTSLIQQLKAISHTPKIPKDESLDIKRLALAEKYRQISRLKRLAEDQEKRIEHLETKLEQRLNEIQSAHNASDQDAVNQLEREATVYRDIIEMKRSHHSEVLDALDGYLTASRQLETSVSMAQRNLDDRK